jgi:hypothetical protein
MAKIERFEDLEIWQLARKLCGEVYRIIETTDLKDNYVLRNQIIAIPAPLWMIWRKVLRETLLKNLDSF